MKNKGIVQNIENNLVTIEIFKDEACSHCNQCDKKIQATQTFYCNDTSLNKGDTVTFYVEDKNILKLSFYLYLLPIFSMLTFYFIAFLLNLNENIKILSSFLGLIVAFLVLFLWDKMNGEKILNNIKITKEKI